MKVIFVEDDKVINGKVTVKEFYDVPKKVANALKVMLENSDEIVSAVYMKNTEEVK